MSLGAEKLAKGGRRLLSPGAPQNSALFYSRPPYRPALLPAHARPAHTHADNAHNRRLFVSWAYYRAYCPQYTHYY